MKYRNIRNSISLLLFFVSGMIFPVVFTYAEQAHMQNAEIAMAKSSAVDYDNRSKEGQSLLSEFSFGLPMTRFEPFLLFILGTILLSIVTGINLLRARKVEFPMHSVHQGDLTKSLKFGAPKSPSKKNKAA